MTLITTFAARIRAFQTALVDEGYTKRQAWKLTLAAVHAGSIS